MIYLFLFTIIATQVDYAIYAPIFFPIIILIIVFSIFLYYNKQKKEENSWGFYFLITLIGTGFTIALSITTIFEYTPNNFSTDVTNTKNMTVLIVRNNPIIVPILNTLNSEQKPLIVELYYNNSEKNISSIRLSSLSDSYLSMETTLLKNSKNNPNVYNTFFTVKHLGLKGNFTSTYKLDIFYNVPGNSSLQQQTIDFNVLTSFKDLTILSYFWIVLLGVVVGRIITIVIKYKDNSFIRLKKIDIIWITVSFIIGITGFTGFMSTTFTTFQNLIIVNIILAFSFGFATEKVLQTVREFDGESASTPPPPSTSSNNR